MKITSFNPIIVTRDPESAVRLFEELGFEKDHQKDGIADSITAIRMKDANGFHLDIATRDSPRDTVVIRMNTDNMKETVQLLTSKGFTWAKGFSGPVETPSSVFSILASPSGFVINIIQHIRK